MQNNVYPGLQDLDEPVDLSCHMGFYYYNQFHSTKQSVNTSIIPLISAQSSQNMVTAFDTL